MANDLSSQETEAPPLPVMVLSGPKFPMEIHWMWTPSPELLETVAPINPTVVACRTEIPAP